MIRYLIGGALGYAAGAAWNAHQAKTHGDMNGFTAEFTAALKDWKSPLNLGGAAIGVLISHHV